MVHPPAALPGHELGRCDRWRRRTSSVASGSSRKAVAICAGHPCPELTPWLSRSNSTVVALRSVLAASAAQAGGVIGSKPPASTRVGMRLRTERVSNGAAWPAPIPGTSRRLGPGVGRGRCRPSADQGGACRLLDIVGVGEGNLLSALHRGEGAQREELALRKEVCQQARCRGGLSSLELGDEPGEKRYQVGRVQRLEGEADQPPPRRVPPRTGRPRTRRSPGPSAAPRRAR